MSSFSELMAMPLPSKRNMVATEAAGDVATVSDEEIEKKTKNDDDKDLEKGKTGKAEECGDAGTAGVQESDVGTDDINDLDLGDLDDLNLDDLDDAELEQLDRDLGGEAIDAVAGTDGETEQDLTPDEEVEADDMMSVAATSMLVNYELNAEEKAAFVSNEAEVNTAINEGFMTEADVNELMVECNVVKENAYNKKMIIRLDAEAKKKQLYAVAINVSAAAHNDPDYRKLRKVMQARRILRARLVKKYHAQAMKRMKIYFNRLRKSRSGVLQKIANAVTKKED